MTAPEPPPAHPVTAVPDRLFADDAAEQRWRARFTATRMSRPHWARDAPDRNVYTSNATGTTEVYAWDRATGTHRQVTDRRSGTHLAELPPDGEAVWWFADTDGDEFGQWVAEPFAGRAARRRPEPCGARASRTATRPASRSAGDSSRSAPPPTTAPASGCRDAAARRRRPRRLRARRGRRRRRAVRRRDAARDLALRARRLAAPRGPGRPHRRRRRRRREVRRPRDSASTALAFAPVAGDQRLLLLHERRGREELLIWDVATGHRDRARDRPARRARRRLLPRTRRRCWSGTPTPPAPGCTATTSRPAR